VVALDSGPDLASGILIGLTTLGPASSLLALKCARARRRASTEDITMFIVDGVAGLAGGLTGPVLVGLFVFGAG